MPTMLRIAGLQFVVWPIDHAPAHVHALSAEAAATIDLGDSSEYRVLVESRRMTKAVLARALAGVFEHRTVLMRKWSDIHG